jgi:hypothetical protein
MEQELDRELIIELQNKTLSELQQTLLTEDLFYMLFQVDDGTRSGYNVGSILMEYPEIKKRRLRGGIYKKTITETRTVEFIKCDKCGAETCTSNIMFGPPSMWHVVDDVYYCYSCQEKFKVGRCDPKNKNDETN